MFRFAIYVRPFKWFDVCQMSNRFEWNDRWTNAGRWTRKKAIQNALAHTGEFGFITKLPYQHEMLMPQCLLHVIRTLSHPAEWNDEICQKLHSKRFFCSSSFRRLFVLLRSPDLALCVCLGAACGKHAQSAAATAARNVASAVRIVGRTVSSSSLPISRNFVPFTILCIIFQWIFCFIIIFCLSIFSPPFTSVFFLRFSGRLGSVVLCDVRRTPDCVACINTNNETIWMHIVLCSDSKSGARTSHIVVDSIRHTHSMSMFMLCCFVCLFCSIILFFFICWLLCPLVSWPLCVRLSRTSILILWNECDLTCKLFHAHFFIFFFATRALAQQRRNVEKNYIK